MAAVVSQPLRERTESAVTISARSGADLGGADPSGLMYVQNQAKSKTWSKFFFVLTGSRLRWYDSQEAYNMFGVSAARGELMCLSIEDIGPRLLSLRNSLGKSGVVVRTDMG